jgi:hypothetical protein
MRPPFPAPEPPTIAIITRSCRLDRGADFTETEGPLAVTIPSATAADRAGRRQHSRRDRSTARDVHLGRAVIAPGGRGHPNMLSDGGLGVAAELAAPTLADAPPVPPSRLELSHVPEDHYLLLRDGRR